MKDKILADIKEAEKIGLKVQPGSFGNQNNLKCCAMTAVAMAAVGPSAISDNENRFREEWVMPEAAKRLGVDNDWISGFIKGYDTPKGAAPYKRAAYKEGFAMGREVRKEQGFRSSKTDD